MSQLTFSEKYIYTSKVRAQLSHFDLMWLYYNCISDNGVVKFKPLIEIYALFKNMYINRLANPHTKIYMKQVLLQGKINSTTIH